MKMKSRKFWLTVIAFACMMVIYFTSGKNEAAITGCISIITYVLGESYADGQSARGYRSKRYDSDEDDLSMF